MLQKFAQKAMGRRINLLFRLTMMYLRGEMKKIGVGTGDYTIIIFLLMQDGQSQDELSKRLRVDKSYTARAVAKMEKMGLIQRRPDPEAHRVKRVFLTQKALDMAPDFFAILLGWQAILVKDIDPADLDTALMVMDRMMANAEASLGLDAIPIPTQKETP